MTGTAWIDESGLLEGPVLLTNTSSVGTARDAVIAWRIARGRCRDRWILPVVAETWDGYLNDAHGFHVRQEHVFQAIDGAQPGAVEEGNVGGGTGMSCYQFKGGIGTASRVVEVSQGHYCVGVLVQANFGQRHQLRIAGLPVGRELAQHALPQRESGSIIILVATDAPLLPHQLKAVAKRAGLGMARTGGIGGNSSGDLFLAFSTGNLNEAELSENASVTMLSSSGIDPIYEATIQATEEAIINALIAAETMTGVNGRTAFALPHDRLQEILLQYNVGGAAQGAPS
jgi:D-aminopeptidase